MSLVDRHSFETPRCSQNGKVGTLESRQSVLHGDSPTDLFGPPDCGCSPFQTGGKPKACTSADQVRDMATVAYEKLGQHYRTGPGGEHVELFHALLDSERGGLYLDHNTLLFIP